MHWKENPESSTALRKPATLTLALVVLISFEFPDPTEFFPVWGLCTYGPLSLELFPYPNPPWPWSGSLLLNLLGNLLWEHFSNIINHNNYPFPFMLPHTIYNDLNLFVIWLPTRIQAPWEQDLWGLVHFCVTSMYCPMKRNSFGTQEQFWKEKKEERHERAVGREGEKKGYYRRLCTYFKDTAVASNALLKIALRMTMWTPAGAVSASASSPLFLTSVTECTWLQMPFICSRNS